MACWGLIPRFWVKDKGFKEDDAVWGEQKLAPGKLCFKLEAILSVFLRFHNLHFLDHFCPCLKQSLLCSVILF